MPIFTKIIYAVLFILLLVHPHFITGHVFSLPQAYVQSLTTLVLAGIASVVYFLHARDIDRKEAEKKRIEDELHISSSKLAEAYTYIGSVNRRLPLLNNVTTDLLQQSKNDKRGKKEILEDLLATATVSLANAPWGMFRFIETARGRTIREFVHTARSHILLKSNVGNNELLHSCAQSSRVLTVKDTHALSTSDREAPVQCFFIFPKGENTIESGLSTLQAIVDQAQLLYKYLYA